MLDKMTEAHASLEDRASELFSAYESQKALLIGVSGGPDSMALLHLCAQWAQPRCISIFAATLDHGLRADARAEAEMVAQYAAKIAVPHSILTWQGDKPATRLQETARAARYALLVEHAHTIGAKALLIAHHADDQMETLLFRLLRGTGPAGLAGMSAQRLHLGMILGRPLLDVRKSELVDYCQRHAIPFVTDPSNTDPHYARTHLRALAPILEAEGMRPQDWQRLAKRAARMEAAILAQLHEARAQLKAQRSADSFKAKAEELHALPDEILLRLVSEEIMRVTQATSPPRLDRAETLLARLREALEQDQPLKLTLADALIELTRHGQLEITPAPARNTPIAGANSV